jgi:hypothetical protein
MGASGQRDTVFLTLGPKVYRIGRG